MKCMSTVSAEENSVVSSVSGLKVHKSYQSVKVSYTERFIEDLP